MNKRLSQVNELIKRELSQILLRELDFPEKVLVTITDVKTSSNLSQVRVWISAIPESHSEKVLRILNKQIYFIQQVLNKRLNMRPVPKIVFAREKQFSEAARIEQVLDKMKTFEKNNKNERPGVVTGNRD